MKILYFNCFVLVMVVSGGFITPFERFWEGLITIGLLILLDAFLRILVSATPLTRLVAGGRLPVARQPLTGNR